MTKSAQTAQNDLDLCTNLGSLGIFKVPKLPNSHKVPKMPTCEDRVGVLPYFFGIDQGFGC